MHPAEQSSVTLAEIHFLLLPQKHGSFASPQRCNKKGTKLKLQLFSTGSLTITNKFSTLGPAFPNLRP
jgi:hypothetical protein